MPAIATVISIAMWFGRCGNRAHGALLQVVLSKFVGAPHGREHYSD